MSAAPDVRARALLTPAETADYLRISKATLYRLIHTDPTFPKAIRPMGPVGHPRWKPEQLEAWTSRLAEPDVVDGGRDEPRGSPRASDVEGGRLMASKPPRPSVDDVRP